MKKRIAIIGAGISGLILGQGLNNVADVVVYEKSRGVGGRMSTRYADPFYFDHGTQFFTVRDAAFQDFVSPFIATGKVTEWRGQVIQLGIEQFETQKQWLEPHYVATPNMNSVCKELAKELDLHLLLEVAPLKAHNSSKWTLEDSKGNQLGEYDLVISTAPPEQTVNLFQSALTQNSPLHEASMLGCYALMIGFNKPWDEDWIAAEVEDEIIKWISINSTKLGRDNSRTCIVVHSSNVWAEQHIDNSMDDIHYIMLEKFTALTGISTATADYISIHRWKYAIVNQSNNNGFYCDLKQGIATTGDWGSSSRIEDVWLSAMRLAEIIIQTI